MSSSEGRYVIHKHSGTVDLVDTLHSMTILMGIDNVEAIRVTRSDLEELKQQINKALKKP